jgi:Mg2+ and Co2+ transporter CorA
MADTQNSTKDFLSTFSFQDVDILHDYEVLMDHIRLVQENLRDYFGRHLATLRLEDSKKSIEQAVTVDRLTKLAFFFLPLNFITSAFGMNITQLGTGNAELWMFFVVVVLLGEVIVAMVLLRLGFAGEAFVRGHKVLCIIKEALFGMKPARIIISIPGDYSCAT